MIGIAINMVIIAMSIVLNGIIIRRNNIKIGMDIFAL